MSKKKIKILLIDDDAMTLKFVRHIYSNSDNAIEYAITTALSIKEGSNVLSENKFDVILLDLGLPDSKGLEGIRKIRSINQDTPIVILTAVSDQSTGIESIKLGAEDYLVKSHVSRQLAEKSVLYAIERKRMKQEILKSNSELENKVLERTAELEKTNIELQKRIRETEKSRNEVRVLTQQLEFVLGATQTGLNIVDDEFNVKYVDPAWQKKLGDYKGKKCYKYFMDLDEPCEGCGAMKALETNSIVVSEEYLAKEDNRPIEVKSIPFKGSNGELLVAEINLDISERKKNEKKIRESEERFKLVAEASQEAIWDWDLKTNKVWRNNTCYKLFGKGSNNNFEWWAEKIHPDDKDIIIKKITDFIATNKKFFKNEYRLRRKDGSYAYVIDRGSVIRDINGKALRLIGSMVDITERIEKQKELERLNEEQKKAVDKLTMLNVELQDFAHVVAHDLKNPIRAVGTLASWLSCDYAEQLDDKGQENLEMLLKRAQQANIMMDGILEYCGVGRISEHKQNIDIGKLVEHVIDTLGPCDRTRFRINTPLPCIKGQRRRILQIFQNLVSNAVKYTDPAKRVIEIGAEEKPEHWQFYVKDNGNGIDSEYIGKIFDLFETSEIEDRSESPGVGLTLVKKIIDNFEGDIWVESEPGKGSTFYFTITKEEASQNKLCVTNN
jgi:PAS domain S-box-containing protein